MKKLISLFILFTMIIGCEIGVHAHPIPSTIVVEKQICEPDHYSMYWASYCDESCCYYEYYDNNWLCENAWCYDYYYCDWQYMGEICY